MNIGNDRNNNIRLLVVIHLDKALNCTGTKRLEVKALTLSLPHPTLLSIQYEK